MAGLGAARFWSGEFGGVVDHGGVEHGSVDRFGAEENRGDRGLADEVGEAADGAVGALMEVLRLTGQAARPVLMQPERGLECGDELNVTCTPRSRRATARVAAPADGIDRR